MPAEPELDIVVLDRQRGRKVAAQPLRRFLARLGREVPPRRESTLGVCLVSDAQMRSAQRAFRGLDRTTDVLSFPDDGAPGPDGRRHLGDILVSVPAAERQAREAGHAFGRELRLLLLHGYLHLLGYDHEDDGGLMLRYQRRLERRLLDGGTR